MGRSSSLKEKLLAQIQASRANDLLPPERVLAESHGVCRATVAKVMSELEQEGFILRRPGKGTFIAPQDNTVLAEACPQNRKKSEIIIAYPDYFSYIIWENVHLAEVLAMKNNLRLVNLKLQRESNLETIFDIVEECRDLRGLFLMTSATSLQVLDRLDSLNVPIVFLHHCELPDRVSLDRFRNIYQVTSDPYRAGYMKASHLLQQGHNRIAYIRNEPRSITTQSHLDGIKQALYDNGLRLKDLLITDSPRPWECSRKAGYLLTQKLLATANDRTALLYDTLPGASAGLKALYENNLKCPEDLSIIASSNENEYDEFTCPALCALLHSNEELMDTAMSMLLAPEKVPGRQAALGGRLIEGESVRNLTKYPTQEKTT